MEQKDESYYIERILDGETEYFSVFLDRYSRPLYTLVAPNLYHQIANNGNLSRKRPQLHLYMFVLNPYKKHQSLDKLFECARCRRWIKFLDVKSWSD